MTLEHWTWLELISSPFLFSGFSAEAFCAKPGIAADINSFLWIVSPHFQPSSNVGGKWRRRFDRVTFRLFESKRDRFNRIYAPVFQRPVIDVVTAILDYVDESFLDAGTSESGQRSFFSCAASCMAQMCKHYRMDLSTAESRARLMKMPLKIVFQYLNIASRWMDPASPLENKLSDAAIRDWMKSVNEKADHGQ